MATYTVFIVTRNARHHYPVIMANNGKAILNEPVKRAWDLEKSANSLIVQAYHGSVTVERITEKAFKAKFPKFAANKGPKKKAALKPWAPANVWVPKTGDKVVITGKSKIGRKRHPIGSIQKISMTFSDGIHAIGNFIYTRSSYRKATPAEIKAGKGKVSAPAKRITKKVTNPVK